MREKTGGNETQIRVYSMKNFWPGDKAAEPEKPLSTR
jgi:hypothetical protein